VLQVVLLGCGPQGWRVSPLIGGLGGGTAACTDGLRGLQVQNTLKSAKSLLTLSILVFQVNPGEGRTEIQVIQVSPVIGILCRPGHKPPPSPTLGLDLPIFVFQAS